MSPVHIKMDLPHPIKTGIHQHIRTDRHPTTQVMCVISHQHEDNKKTKLQIYWNKQCPDL